MPVSPNTTTAPTPTWLIGPEVPPKARLGTVLNGTYRLDGFLGQGMTGISYNAWHLRHKTAFAVKLIHRDLAPTHDRVSRLRQDLRVMAALGQHGFPATELGFAPDGAPFLAAELAPGETLRERLRRGALSALEAGTVVAALARSLDVAHQAGVVHGDLRPESVILAGAGGPDAATATAGRPVLLDAALHHLRRRPIGLDEGLPLGKLAYLAPEQASGEVTSADVPGDVFALGAILYECLTGKQAFSGPEIEVVLEKLAQPPARLALPPGPGTPPGLASALDVVIAGACARDPEVRVPAMADFLLALSAAYAGAGLPLPEAGAGGAAPASRAARRSTVAHRKVAPIRPDSSAGKQPAAQDEAAQPTPVPAAATEPAAAPGPPPTPAARPAGPQRATVLARDISKLLADVQAGRVDPQRAIALAANGEPEGEAEAPAAKELTEEERIAAAGRAAVLARAEAARQMRQQEEAERAKREAEAALQAKQRVLKEARAAVLSKMRAELDEKDEQARAERARREEERAERRRKETEQAQAELARLEAERAEAARKEAEQAEIARREAERAETARREAEAAEQAKKEADRQEALRREAERLEAERAEAARREAEAAEQARMEAAMWEAARAEAARKEVERAEAAQREAQERERQRQAAAVAAQVAAQAAQAAQAAAVSDEPQAAQGAASAEARAQEARQEEERAIKEAALAEAQAREAQDRAREAEFEAELARTEEARRAREAARTAQAAREAEEARAREAAQVREAEAAVQAARATEEERQKEAAQAAAAARAATEAAAREAAQVKRLTQAMVVVRQTLQLSLADVEEEMAQWGPEAGPGPQQQAKDEKPAGSEAPTMMLPHLSSAPPLASARAPAPAAPAEGPKQIVPAIRIAPSAGRPASEAYPPTAQVRALGRGPAAAPNAGPFRGGLPIGPFSFLLGAIGATVAIVGVLLVLRRQPQPVLPAPGPGPMPVRVEPPAALSPPPALGAAPAAPAPAPDARAPGEDRPPATRAWPVRTSQQEGPPAPHHRHRPPKSDTAAAGSPGGAPEAPASGEDLRNPFKLK